MTSARAHALKEQASRAERFAKARARRELETCKGGVLTGKLTETVNTLYALEAEGQRSAKKKVLGRLRAIKPQIAFRLQGGALLRESGK